MRAKMTVLEKPPNPRMPDPSGRTFILNLNKATWLRAALAKRSHKRVLVVTVPWYLE